MILICSFLFFFFFFFNDTATTEIYTLSLHDALPISEYARRPSALGRDHQRGCQAGPPRVLRDRKSTRLNSSPDQISYAVFCLKKKHNTTAVSPTPTSTARPHKGAVSRIAS